MHPRTITVLLSPQLVLQFDVMNNFALPKAARDVLRAVLAGVLIGAILSALVLAGLQSDLLQQKFMSLRYRVAALLPHAAEPQFVPTPLALPSANGRPPTDEPTQTLESSFDPTPEGTRHPVTLPATPSIVRPPSSIPRTRTPTLPPDVTPVQPMVALRAIKADYQRWNNCGPTTLGMALQYFGKTDPQAEIATFTKPNPDDRNVRPDELAAYANRAGLRTIIRVNGTLDRLKLLLSNGVPVIIETALVKQPQGWMGHYRLLIGYDATQFNTMDSYDGPNVKISFADLDAEWRTFNRIYLVVYANAPAARVRAILADTLDDQTMYAQAAARARAEIAADPKDAFAQFNLGSSLAGMKLYAPAAAAFDKARMLGLPWRMLWYQHDPYIAYLRVGRNEEVIALADSLLSKTNDLEEAHYYKGLALRALKREPEARREFETALHYNPNYRDALNAMTNDK
jgi:tetratricopeptide (TPR) repeat protein